MVSQGALDVNNRIAGKLIRVHKGPKDGGHPVETGRTIDEHLQDGFKYELPLARFCQDQAPL